MAKRRKGDTFETHIGSVSGPVHTGKGDIIVERWDARAVTAADLEALRALFGDLRARVTRPRGLKRHVHAPAARHLPDPLNRIALIGLENRGRAQLLRERQALGNQVCRIRCPGARDARDHQGQQSDGPAPQDGHGH